MKENVRNISVLIPNSRESQIPSLGYSSIKEVLNQAFPGIEINPQYLDSSSGLTETDILIANFYSTLGFVDLLRVLSDQGFSSDRKTNPFLTVISGTGALNPLPIKDTVDFVTFNEKGLIELISKETGREPQTWEQPDPIWAKTDYITSIMPTLSCIYNCVFCQLKKQNDSRFQYSSLERIERIISEGKPNRILVHSASILQYPFFDELVRMLDQSRAAIYMGSMNLIDIDQQKAEDLLKLSPRHTIAAEKDTDVQLYFGLETGSDKVLRRMRKPLTREIATQRVQVLHNAGFKHLGFYLIVGYPNTDERDFTDTADMLNTIADTMGNDSRISIKCTPFLPHLATEVREEPARYWAECVKELNWIINSTRPNIDFDISDPFYYLTSIVLIRGGNDHAGLVQKLAGQKDLQIKDDADIESLLDQLGLPNLNTHLKGKPPLDLSLFPKPFIPTENL